MIPEERREKIIEKLRSNRLYTLDRLKEELEVSRVTIQRDVNLLVEKEIVDKVHGGVKIKKTKRNLFETRFEVRLNQNYDKKLEKILDTKDLL